MGRFQGKMMKRKRKAHDSAADAGPSATVKLWRDRPRKPKFYTDRIDRMLEIT